MLRQRYTNRRWGWWGAVAAATAVITVATLRPSTGGPLLTFDTCLLCGRDPVADAVRNVILFVPLGLALGFATRAWVRAFIAAALLSAFVEFIQQWLPGRDPSLGDILTNSTGAAVGLALAAWPRLWIRASGWLSLAAGVLAALGLFAGGLLLRPDFSSHIHNAQWTQRVDKLEWYRGTVLDATLGTMEIPNHRIAQPAAVAALLKAGAPVRVRLVTGPPVQSLSSLFSIFDSGWNEVFLLGPDRRDLVLRYAMRARHFRLDEPDLHARGLSLGPAGDTVTVSAWHEPDGYCMSVGGVERCHLGFTLGSEWALIWFTPALPLGVRGGLDLFWIALLAGPCGFWALRDWRAAAGAAGIALALAFAPALTGLLPTPPVQWLAAAFGLGAGAVLRRTLQWWQRA